jgi:NAD(P)-dependent dehydrogenase (short-subunit alcohol dehydrogenase family)
VAILVNNAGSSTGSSLLTGDVAAIRLEMDTHFFGTLAVTRAFAPQLAAQGKGGAEHLVSAVLAEHPRVLRLLRREIGGVVAHQRPAPGSWHRRARR